MNALQEGKDPKSIIVVIGIAFALSVVELFLLQYRSYYYIINYPKLDVKLQTMLQKKAVEADLECFEDPEFFDTYVKARESVFSKATDVIGTFSNLVYCLVSIFALGALLASVSPLFLMIASAPLVFRMILGKKQNKLKFEYNMSNQEIARRRDYVRRTFYLKDFSKEMRLTNMQNVMFGRMRESVKGMKENVGKYGYKLMFFRYLFDLLYFVAVYGVCVVIAVYKTLVTKTMLLGNCFVVIRSINELAGRMEHIGGSILRIDDNSLYIEKLREFLDYEIKIAEDKNAPDAPRFEKLELKSVSFKYASQSENALSNIDLSVRSGEKIALVGYNGAGKTTLAKLLLRFYDPTEGEILYNGKNIKNWRLSTYRSRFGTVFQDCRLFAATVSENVLLRKAEETDRETVENALSKAGLSEKIEKLPDKENNQVTKEFDKAGAVFSGGEAQKLAIARLFALPSDIVIMDEPTSALDPMAEKEMYENMFDACKNKAVIFISHRLSSAAMADRVYMFENGKITESGTHSELLAKNGAYADMWHKQADYYKDLR